MPETPASSIHVVTVNLRGAVPLLWRRLELPSAMTFHQLHEVLTETFGWSEFGPHSFVTNHGEFGGQVRPASRAAVDSVILQG
jgi:Plasmid pRiA4b ORF-3-like protein